MNFPPPAGSEGNRGESNAYPANGSHNADMPARSSESLANNPPQSHSNHQSPQWPTIYPDDPQSVSLSQQQQLRTRQKHHVSLPPVYYATSGYSQAGAGPVAYMAPAPPAPVAGSVPGAVPAPMPAPSVSNGISGMAPAQPQYPVMQLQNAYGQPLQQPPQQAVPAYQPVSQLQGSQNLVNVRPRIPGPVSQLGVPTQGSQQVPSFTRSASTYSQSPYGYQSPSHTPSPTPSPDTALNTPPRLRRVQSWSQLKPMVVQVPKNRRAKPEGGFMSPLLALTTFLPATYSICDPRFQYSQTKNPRRVLTEPHEGHLNNGFDNVESDYILYVNDILGADANRRYLTLNLLGKGTFGQVVKCQNMSTMEVVAVKVIKNKPAFLNQSMMEVSILEHIQQNVDKDDTHNLLRLKDRFMHKEHLCLVFELLSSNLYEVIKKNKFRGLGINVVRAFAQQLLDSLAVLKSASLIHCDLKPENILLKRHDGLAIKVIDFGSACHERQTVYTYIQSRFYRSPEVILGLPYTSSIDMWSLGCIIAELFLGLPIFPGASEYDQWSRIVESLGMPPSWMLDMGKTTGNFMEKTPQGAWRLRTIEEQNRLFNSTEKEGKKYFATSDIHETIMNYPFPHDNMTPAAINDELKQRESLSDFVRGLLTFNPFERWTPQQAAMHPFISRQRYVGPFSPNSTSTQAIISSLPEPARYRSASNYAHAQAQAQAQASAKMQSQTQQPVGQTIPQVRPTYQQQQGSLHYPLQQPPPLAPQQYVAQPPLPMPQPILAQTSQPRAVPQSGRGRSATIGQVNATVPVPIQQAAARMDPNDVIQGNGSPAYFPPSNFY